MNDFFERHRILRRFAKVATTIVAIFLIYSIYEAIRTYINNQPEIVTKLENIEIGQKFEDFMFKNSGFEIDTKERKIEDEIYYSRKAENQQNYASVTIKDNKVLRVLLQCNDSYDLTTVNGIGCHSYGETIIEKFGQLVNIQCLKDKNNENYLKYRVYDVKKYGVRYHLISNQIIAFSIAPTNDFTHINWTNCS
jgi:hypothetical protein